MSEQGPVKGQARRLRYATGQARGPRFALALPAYNLGIAAASPFLGAYLAWRIAKGKSREGWSERWGRLPEAISASGRPRIWMHAASVGEVGAARPVVKALREARADAEVIMTVITPGGREVAEALVGSLISGVAYLPFDLPWLTRKAAHTIRPDLFVGVETEIWPNLLSSVKATGARCALVNARISDRSYPRYRKVAWLTRWALSAYDVVLAQSDEDARRFVALGADPTAVRTLGNVKFDEADRPLSPQEIEELRADLELEAAGPVWVAGSTRIAAEERMVWEAHRAVMAAVPNAVLIHAPRHVARADEVEAGMREAGLRPIRRSHRNPSSPAERQRSSPWGEGGPFDAIILDTFGELGKVYAVGDIAFIGNSLVQPGGGQNLLQPLAQGKGVLFGPYTSNFRDAVQIALAAGVGRLVETAEQLATEVVSALRNPDHRRRIEEDALSLIAANRGAAVRYAAELATLLGCCAEAGRTPEQSNA